MNRSAKNRPALAVVAMVLCVASAASAASPRALIEDGNRLVGQNKQKEALAKYAEASVGLPESPIIAYNNGIALFRQEQYAKALEEFRKCARKTRDVKLEARARYNEGNCLYYRGVRRLKDKPSEAIETLRNAVRGYQRTLYLDPGDADAKYNIEVVRLKIKDLLDRQKEQQKKQQQQQKALKDIIERLRKAIVAQKKLRDESETLDKAKPGPSNLKSQSLQLAGRQDTLQKDAQKIREDLKGLAPPKQPPRQKGAPASKVSPPERAAMHVEQAAVHQADSAAHLRDAKPDVSLGPQDESVKRLRQALAELVKPREGQPSQKKQQKKKQQPKQDKRQKKAPKPKEDPRKVLKKEKRDNKERRRVRPQYGAERVEKDW